MQALSVSESTIRRIADKDQCHRRVARRKPLLNEAAKKKRLQSAKEHIQWTESDWNKVIWTDECTCERGELKHRRYVWHRPGEEDDDDMIVSTFKSGRFSASIWAPMDSHNKLYLKILELPGPKRVNSKIVDRGGFTARRYIAQVLDPIAKTIWTRKSTKTEMLSGWKTIARSMHRLKWRGGDRSIPYRYSNTHPIAPTWTLSNTSILRNYIKHELEKEVWLPVSKDELAQE